MERILLVIGIVVMTDLRRFWWRIYLLNTYGFNLMSINIGVGWVKVSVDFGEIDVGMTDGGGCSGNGSGKSRRNKSKS